MLCVGEGGGWGARENRTTVAPSLRVLLHGGIGASRVSLGMCKKEHFA